MEDQDSISDISLSELEDGDQSDIVSHKLVKFLLQKIQLKSAEFNAYSEIMLAKMQVFLAKKELKLSIQKNKPKQRCRHCFRQTKSKSEGNSPSRSPQCLPPFLHALDRSSTRVAKRSRRSSYFSTCEQVRRPSSAFQEPSISSTLQPIQEATSLESLDSVREDINEVISMINRANKTIDAIKTRRDGNLPSDERITSTHGMDGSDVHMKTLSDIIRLGEPLDPVDTNTNENLHQNSRIPNYDLLMTPIAQVSQVPVPDMDDNNNNQEVNNNYNYFPAISSPQIFAFTATSDESRSGATENRLDANKDMNDVGTSGNVQHDQRENGIPEVFQEQQQNIDTANSDIMVQTSIESDKPNKDLNTDVATNSVPSEEAMIEEMLRYHILACERYQPNLTLPANPKVSPQILTNTVATQNVTPANHTLTYQMYQQNRTLSENPDVPNVTTNQVNVDAVQNTGVLTNVPSQVPQNLDISGNHTLACQMYQQNLISSHTDVPELTHISTIPNKINKDLVTVVVNSKDTELSQQALADIWDGLSPLKRVTIRNFVHSIDRPQNPETTKVSELVVTSVTAGNENRIHSNSDQRNYIAVEENQSKLLEALKVKDRDIKRKNCGKSSHRRHRKRAKSDRKESSIDQQIKPSKDVMVKSSVIKKSDTVCSIDKNTPIHHTTDTVVKQNNNISDQSKLSQDNTKSSSAPKQIDQNLQKEKKSKSRSRSHKRKRMDDDTKDKVDSNQHKDDRKAEKKMKPNQPFDNKNGSHKDKKTSDVSDKPKTTSSNRNVPDWPYDTKTYWRKNTAAKSDGQPSDSKTVSQPKQQSKDDGISSAKVKTILKSDPKPKPSKHSSSKQKLTINIPNSSQQSQNKVQNKLVNRIHDGVQHFDSPASPDLEPLAFVEKNPRRFDKFLSERTPTYPAFKSASNSSINSVGTISNRNPAKNLHQTVSTYSNTSKTATVSLNSVGTISEKNSSSNLAKHTESTASSATITKTASTKCVNTSTETKPLDRDPVITNTPKSSGPRTVRRMPVKLDLESFASNLMKLVAPKTDNNTNMEKSVKQKHDINKEDQSKGTTENDEQLTNTIYKEIMYQRKVVKEEDRASLSSQKTAKICMSCNFVGWNHICDTSISPKKETE